MSFFSMNVIAQTEEFASEFGFTSEDITPLTEEYKEDSIFLSLVQEKMELLCPVALTSIKE